MFPAILDEVSLALGNARPKLTFDQLVTGLLRVGGPPDIDAAGRTGSAGGRAVSDPVHPGREDSSGPPCDCLSIPLALVQWQSDMTYGESRLVTSPRELSGEVRPIMSDMSWDVSGRLQRASSG